MQKRAAFLSFAGGVCLFVVLSVLAMTGEFDKPRGDFPFQEETTELLSSLSIAEKQLAQVRREGHAESVVKVEGNE